MQNLLNILCLFSLGQGICQLICVLFALVSRDLFLIDFKEVFKLDIMEDDHSKTGFNDVLIVSALVEFTSC